MPRTLYLLAIPSFVAFSGSAFAASDTRNFTIGLYEEVVVEGDMDVDIRNNAAPSAKATGDAKLVDALKIERVGKVVRISFRHTGFGYTPLPGTVKIALTGRNIRKISLRGSAKITVDAIKTSLGQFDIRGPGEISIGSMQAEKMQVLLNGTGRFAVTKGTAVNGAVHLNGTARFESPELSFNSLTVFQQGAATVTTKAMREVTITNNGPGTITISGTATCTIKQAGSGKISCPKMGGTK